MIKKIFQFCNFIKTLHYITKVSFMEVAVDTYNKTITLPDNEEEYIIAATKDISKFSYFYDKYYIRIFRFIYQRVESDDTAADITSVVFLKAMENLKKYDYRGLPFGSWLYKIALNEVYQEHRNNKIELVYNINTTELKAIATDELEAIEKEEMITTVLKAISLLDRDEIELIEMKYFEKFSYKQIAEITGLTEVNAKVKVHRIIQKLKTKIKK